MALSLFFLGMTCVNGQSRLVLAGKVKPEKKKTIDITRTYQIKTADKVYKSKIVTFSASALSVPMVVKEKDTTYTYSRTQKVYAKRGIRLWKKRTWKDTTYAYTQTRTLYRHDTVSISFKDIRMLKKPWFKKTGWVDVVTEIAFSPLTNTHSLYWGSKTMWQMQAVTLAVCAPAIFIGTRSTRYDLVRKWRLKAEG
jgi:hypothetical protein